MAKKTTAVETVEQNAILEAIKALSNNITSIANRLETIEKKTASIGINTRTAEPQKPTTEQLVKLAVAKMSDSNKFLYVRDKVKYDPTGWNAVALDCVIYKHLLSCKKVEAHEEVELAEPAPSATTSDKFTCDQCKFQKNCKKIANGLEDTCYHLKKARNIQTLATTNKSKAPTTDQPELTGRQLEVYNMLKEGMSKKDIEDTLEITVHGTMYALKKKGYTW